MQAFLIFHSTIHDPEKFQAYARAVPATLQAFSGEIHMRGKLDQVLSGTHKHKSVAILRFPDHAALEGWYQSRAYQDLIELRNSGAETQIMAYSVL